MSHGIPELKKNNQLPHFLACGTSKKKTSKINGTFIDICTITFQLIANLAEYSVLHLTTKIRQPESYKNYETLPTNKISHT